MSHPTLERHVPSATCQVGATLNGRGTPGRAIDLVPALKLNWAAQVLGGIVGAIGAACLGAGSSAAYSHV